MARMIITGKIYQIIISLFCFLFIISGVHGELKPESVNPAIASGGDITAFGSIEPDSYEDDDTPGRASKIILNDRKPQTHNFHHTRDEDWVAFYALEGELYEIEAAILGINSDVVMELYDEGMRPHHCDPEDKECLPINDTGAGNPFGEWYSWKCPKEGVYFLRIYNGSEKFEEHTEYDLKVYWRKGPDIYEDDNVPERADIIVINDPRPQTRNFYPRGDEDWVKFFAFKGELYEIIASKLGINSDVVMELYDEGMKPQHCESDKECPPINDTGAGDPRGEHYSWKCPMDGMYFIRVYNGSYKTLSGMYSGSDEKGEHTEYYLTVSSIGMGMLVGKVMSGLEALGQVRVKVTALAWDDSQPTTGNYKITSLPVDTDLRVVANKSGYKDYSWGFRIDSAQSMRVKHIVMIPVVKCADGDGDGYNIEGGSCGPIDNCPSDFNPGQTDSDWDGVGDVCDNCREVENWDQEDANAGEDDDMSKEGTQHYGDVCDADYDNNGFVGLEDFNELRTWFGQSVPPAPIHIDCDGDDFIGLSDFNCLRSFFGNPPGPGIE